MRNRVVVTRPRKDADEFAQALHALGAEPILFPTIEIKPVSDNTTLDLAISHLHCYDWLILTSANAVEVFSDRLAALGVSALPEALRIAAVGSRTAECLKERGIYPDFVPEEYLSEALTPGLGDLSGCWVLLPNADIASDTLPVAIQQAGGIAHEITVYNTLPATPDPAGMAALKSGVELITFTSGSSARNFMMLVKRAGLDPLDLPGQPRIACIGPKTARVARELGFAVEITAQEYTVDGLIQAIRNHVQETR